MAVDWDAEVLQPMMAQAVFGEAILYTPKSGAGAFQIADAVFDDSYKQIFLLESGEPGVNTSNPTLGVRLAEFAALPVQGDRVAVISKGLSYLVISVEPDGKGHAKLQLNVAQAQP